HGPAGEQHAGEPGQLQERHRERLGDVGSHPGAVVDGITGGAGRAPAPHTISRPTTHHRRKHELMRRLRVRTATRTARVAVLLGVLATMGIGFAVVLAFAATSVPKPTISSAPAGSTNQTSAAFTYTDRKAGVTFQCSLDG